MQESYFKARKFNLEQDLFGSPDSLPDNDSNKEESQYDKANRKVNKSKHALMKILEEDRNSSSSSKLPRSKSGYIHKPYPRITNIPETENDGDSEEVVDISEVFPITN